MFDREAAGYVTFTRRELGVIRRAARAWAEWWPNAAGWRRSVRPSGPSAYDILEAAGMGWGYRRGSVRWTDVERAVRKRAQKHLPKPGADDLTKPCETCGGAVWRANSYDFERARYCSDTCKGAAFARGTQ